MAHEERGHAHQRSRPDEPEPMLLGMVLCRLEAGQTAASLKLDRIERKQDAQLLARLERKLDLLLKMQSDLSPENKAALQAEVDRIAALAPETP